MIKTKHYSLAKKMALIAAIISSINTFYYWIILRLVDYFKNQAFNDHINSFIVANKGNIDMSPSIHQQETAILYHGLGALVYILGSIFTVSFMILVWLTFVKIDTSKEKAWKIYALITGILLALMSLFGMPSELIEHDYLYFIWQLIRLITATFMILSFALGQKSKKKYDDKN